MARSTDPQLALSDPTIHAAVDVGTNSFHLLIARVGAGGRFEIVAREKEMVRLGSGVGDLDEIAEDAMDRGVATLGRFRKVAEAYGAELIAVATSALREAPNRDDFLRRALDEAKVRVAVIPGVEEARLIHLGVIQSLPLFDEQILVVDIGGGSTEFTIGRGRDLRVATSTKIGAIRLTDRFFPDGKVRTESVKECRRFIRSFLVQTIQRLREHRPFEPVGSSGTIATLAQMAVITAGGDPLASVNGVMIKRPQLGEVVDMILSARTARARGELPGLDAKRRDIIVGGALLLEEILDGLALDRITVSDGALREGVLLDLASRAGPATFHHLGDIRRQSVLRMAETYHEELDHIGRATDLALHLFDLLSPIHGLGLDARDHLEAAAMLHNVGLFIAHDAHHKHSYYVIRHTDLLAGFTDRDLEIIAQIARYHRKSPPKASHADHMALPEEDRSEVATLAGILRIGIALDRTRQGGVRRLDVTMNEGAVRIEVITEPGIDLSLEEYTVGERLDLLESSIGRDVEVRFEVSA